MLQSEKPVGESYLYTKPSTFLCTGNNNASNIPVRRTGKGGVYTCLVVNKIVYLGCLV